MNAIEPAPVTDDRDPARLVPEAVDRVLELAATWLVWDGAPRCSDGTVATPVKAMRRVADHLLDHLTEIECLLAGAESEPDNWYGRMVTLESDWARFSELDLAEASSRLRRMAHVWALRLGSLSPDDLDRPRGQHWTIRQIAHHAAGVTFYAEQVGDLFSPR